MAIVQKNSVVAERLKRMNKHVVIINGSAGVGKDTFVEQVRYCFLGNTEMSYPNVINYSSVDWIKKIATSMGWDGAKDEKSRKFLSDLKDLSTWYNDMPFNCMKDKVDSFNDERCQEKILFLHIREPEEISRAAKEFAAKTLLIRNNRVDHVLSNRADADVFEYEYDYIVNNLGTIADLREDAFEFLRWLEDEEV